MSTVTLTTSIDSTELWSRIWGSEPQAAGSHWHEIHYIGCGWETEGTVKVVLEDPDEDGGAITKKITTTDIVTALNNPAFPSHLRQNILDDNADCIDSDAVIQFIVYGDIIFG